MTTGHQQPTSGPPGFPPTDGGPPRDQHHEHVPRGGPDLLAVGLAGGLDGAPRSHASYGPAGAANDQLWSMLAYFGLIFFQFVPPLAIYLAKRRQSPFSRFHAAQALNLWVTAFGYLLCCLIIGGLLALDTISTALAVALPLACLVWACTVGYAVLTGVSASRGRQRELPGWICSPMVR